MRGTLRRLVAVATLAGLAVVGSACGETVCSAVGHAPGVAVTVAPDAAPMVRSLALRVCPEVGTCSSHRVDLAPDPTRPPGTLVGFAVVAELTTRDPAGVVATVTPTSGKKIRYPLLTITPTVVQREGPACGDETMYAVTLDAQGLH